jgi:hypothetical protein
MVIDGKTYTQDLIILPDRILDGWWRQQGHLLHTVDLEAVFHAKPDLLIVGQGAYGRMRVPQETRQNLASSNIELIALPTQEAVTRYNTASRERAIAAAFHLTC